MTLEKFARGVKVEWDRPNDALPDINIAFSEIHSDSKKYARDT